MSEFFAMGGYGFFIWSSYGIAISILLALFIYTKGCEQRNKRAIEKRIRLEERRNSRDTTS
jgi:heme exporter protein D